MIAEFFINLTRVTIICKKIIIRKCVYFKFIIENGTKIYIYQNISVETNSELISKHPVQFPTNFLKINSIGHDPFI